MMSKSSPDKRPHAPAEVAHLETAVREAQSALKRSRVMRSDAEGLVEIVLRGDFRLSRVHIKAKLADELRVQLEDAIRAAHEEAVEAVYEEQRTRFAKLLPTGALSDAIEEPSTVMDEAAPDLVSVKTGTTTAKSAKPASTSAKLTGQKGKR